MEGKRALCSKAAGDGRPVALLVFKGVTIALGRGFGLEFPGVPFWENAQAPPGIPVRKGKDMQEKKYCLRQLDIRTAEQAKALG